MFQFVFLQLEGTVKPPLCKKDKLEHFTALQGLIAKLPKMLLGQQFVPESLVRELRLHTCTSSNLHICKFAYLHICLSKMGIIVFIIAIIVNL